MALLSPDQVIADPTSGGLWGWVGMCGAALSVSAVLLAFIYLWANLFRNAQLMGYVKQELYELVVSGVLILILFGGVGAMSSLTIGSLVPYALLPSGTDASTTIYNATGLYFQQVDRDMSGWLEMNYVLNMYVDQVASVTPYARPLGVGLVASPMAGFAAPLKQLFYNMSVGLTMAFIINQAQLIIYVFSLHAFLKFYLPLGMFLRCFTPTRAIGGTLIGVAVAFLFVFPALVVITYCMLYNDAAGPLLTFRSVLGQYVTDIVHNFVNFYENKFTGASLNQQGDVVDLVGGAFGGIGQLLQNVAGGMFVSIMMIPISVISWAFVIGFVIPVFNAMLFTQAAKALSKTFGEEVDISSLTRMI